MVALGIYKVDTCSSKQSNVVKAQKRSLALLRFFMARIREKSLRKRRMTNYPDADVQFLQLTLLKIDFYLLFKLQRRDCELYLEVPKSYFFAGLAS